MKFKSDNGTDLFKEKLKRKTNNGEKKFNDVIR